MAAILELSNVVKHFPVRRGLLAPNRHVHAIDGVSFSIEAGDTFGLVGESGCGKTTLGKSIVRLVDVTGGEIRFDGETISGLSEPRFRPYRQKITMVFQDPATSLNPRLRVRSLLTEPIRFQRLNLSKAEIDRAVDRALTDVGLNLRYRNRYPHEFSGGQQQRIGIARALILQPKFIVCDEAVSALDVSVQAQILNLLNDLQQQYALTYLFISHDLSVVKYMSKKIAVMYLGKVVEQGPTDAVMEDPAHPYTEALLSAAPEPDIHRVRQRIILEGEVPSPMNIPTGCRFRARCPHATELCSRVEPEPREIVPGRTVACHHFEKIRAAKRLHGGGGVVSGGTNGGHP